MKNEPDKVLKIFGNSLRKIRKSRGLSQEEFAFQCGLDRTYISGLECGIRNPTLKVLTTIANHLEVSLSELLLHIENNDPINEKNH